MADNITSGPMITELEISTDLRELNILENDTPVLPLRDMVLFPHIPLPITIGRDSSLQIVQQAYESKTAIAAVAQKDPAVENPGKKDLYTIGMLCKVAKVMQIPEGPVTAFVVPIVPVSLGKVVKKKPFMRAEITQIPQILPAPGNMEMIVLAESVFETYQNILQYIGDNEQKEIQFALQQFDDRVIDRLNFIAFNSPLDYHEKQQLLEISDVHKRTSMLYHHLDLALQKLELRADIQTRTHEDLTQMQKEQFLKQQMRAIRDELGSDAGDADIDELNERAAKMPWNKDAQTHYEKEVRKLERYSPQSPEYAIQYAYLDTLLNLPWNKYSPDNFSLDKVEKILDRDHYGLDKVKERIIEQMAVVKLRKDMKAPIICLYGPPGVGKTSLGKSVADALGREYTRISLGGLHDEAEIRGHRRTYIGAMPGRIMAALEKCGTGNPVFVLDEIDKIGSDFKGDPSTALLEVLDPEQNNKFHDNYIDCDYDLSKILFIATANDLSTISRPLLDRMEIIEIDGYIPEEKIEIARRHLVAKSLEEHGFPSDEITFRRDALAYIVERYTRESGVRQLEKRIAKILRKIARLKASDKDYPRIVTLKNVKEFLGKEEVNPDSYESNEFLGVVTGLAWTQVGGEILFIESSLSEGKGEKLTLTGNLGAVMKESAVIALQYLKAHARQLGIDPKKFSEMDVHVHVPEGAIPKDGPSAGITMVTSLASSFTGRKVRSKVAMTGEITLRGKVLPVGGIKEKILAAKRAGITDIVLCEENRKDIEEISDRYLEGLTFHYVSKIEAVPDFALE